MEKFHGLYDDDVKYPEMGDGAAKIANAGKEIVAKQTTEAPCDESDADQSANKNRMNADGVNKRPGKSRE